MLAAIPDAAYSATLASWWVDAASPTPAQLAQAELLVRGCRIKCGVHRMPGAGGDPACWSGGFSPKVCCSLEHGPRGNLACWDVTFTYERCCGTPIAEPATPSSPSDHISEHPPFHAVIEGFFKGPTGEAISPMPSEYAFVGAAVLAALCILVSCFHRCRAWMSAWTKRRNDVCVSDVDVAMHRQKRVDHFDTTAEPWQQHQ